MTDPDTRPFGTQRTNRRQRRAGERARAEWAAVEQRRRGGTPTGPEPDEPKRLRAPRRPAGTTPVDATPATDDTAGDTAGDTVAVPAAAVIVVSAAAVAAACVAVGTGAPVLGHGWRLGWFFAAGAAAGSGFVWSWRHRLSFARRVRAAVVVGVVVTVGLFTWGAATTILIDGRPVPATSVEAQSWRIANELYADLVDMAAYDERLALPIAAARAEYDAYAVAQRDMERLNRKWTARLDDLPAEAFRPAVEAARDAAYWGAQALEAKARTVVQTDSALENQAVTSREAYAGFVLAAGRRLSEAAALYRIPLTGSDAGPVE